MEPIFEKFENGEKCGKREKRGKLIDFEIARKRAVCELMAAYNSTFKAFLSLANGETTTLQPGSTILGRGNEFGIHDRRVRYVLFVRYLL